MDFTPLFNAAKENLPIAVIVALSLAVVGLVKLLIASHNARLEDAKAARESERKQSAEHLATAMVVAPLASKLVDCVVLLDRAMTRGGSQ